MVSAVGLIAPQEKCIARAAASHGQLRTLRDEYRTIDTTQARIVLVEAGPTILQAFPEKLRNAARRSLRRLGVDVREGAAVTHIDAHGVMVGEERINAATVLWSAGVAASPLLRTLGAPRRTGSPGSFIAPPITIAAAGGWMPCETITSAAGT